MDDGYLFVVHEVDHSERLVRYLHRFVLLGDDLVLAAISSLSLSRLTESSSVPEWPSPRANSLLSFGVSDAASGLATVPAHEVLELLEPTAAHSTAERIGGSGSA